MKEILRKKYLIERQNIQDKELKDKKIFQKVIHNEKIKKARKILIYVSLKEEVDTLNLIKYFLENSYLVAVPKVEGTEMHFFIIKSLEELKVGYKGIREPNNNDMVNDYKDWVCLTPGICFDKLGYRIGYGKGFYDKFFSKYNGYKIGLCYQELLIDSVKPNYFDIPVSEVITD